MGMEMEAATMALDMIMGISNGVVEEAKVGATNTINSANAYASNLVSSANAYSANTARTSGNNVRKSRAELARGVQTENNRRTLDNTGENYATAAMNYRRVRDSATNDSVETQIAFAEQAGQQRAAAAFRGLQGGVVDLVDATTRLRKSRLTQRSDEALRLGDYDAGQRQKQILQVGWDSLDSSEISADEDFGINIATTQVATTQRYNGNLFTEAYGKGKSVQGMSNLASEAGSFFKTKAGPADYLDNGQVR